MFNLLGHSCHINNVCTSIIGLQFLLVGITRIMTYILKRTKWCSMVCVKVGVVFTPLSINNAMKTKKTFKIMEHCHRCRKCVLVHGNQHWRWRFYWINRILWSNKFKRCPNVAALLFIFTPLKVNFAIESWIWTKQPTSFAE